MFKEAIQHIQETASKPFLQEIDGVTYLIDRDGQYQQVKPELEYPEELTLTSLDALVKLVKTEASEEDVPLYITIPDHLTAVCFGQPDSELRFHRVNYYRAKATDVPGWQSDVKMGFEEMQIALRTRFQETTDAAYAMKLLSDITTGGKITFNDNGVATSVVTQKGVALQANEAIRPIVKLKPYRTFQEVEQPESPFLIRVSERGISFTEADGGMWKLKARETIKAFLEERLQQEVSTGAVVIAL